MARYLRDEQLSNFTISADAISQLVDVLFARFLLMPEYVPNFSMLAECLVHLLVPTPNKTFQRDKVALSHLLQRAQKLRHNNFADLQPL